MSNIDEILDRSLTREQYAAAVAPEREVLALACAGSGKSRTLAYRVARLIAEGESPEGIVAFTFTDKAAESIKLRVSQALSHCGIDPACVGAMYIGTIHSWCHRILAAMDARYRQYEVLDDMRMQMYLMSRYPQLQLKQIRDERNARYFQVIEKVKDAWSTLNEERCNIADISTHDPILASTLKNLDQRLHEDQFIDFASMIRLVVEALDSGHPGIERTLKSLNHVLVDEYQDINPVQERLIQLMRERSKTLFVVGDDDQAIYAWRGADVSNILTFRERYPSAASHSLTCNFRSTHEIVAAADGFAAAELGATRLTKHPTAAPVDGPSEFGVSFFEDRYQEAEWVADRIKQLLGTEYRDDEYSHPRGLTPADFAILMRSTQGKEGDVQRHTAFTRALANRGIEYVIDAGGGLFSRPQACALRDAFQLLRHNNPTREQLRDLYEQQLLPSFPLANFNQLASVYNQWGTRIHTPARGSDTTRQRLYPQQLLQEMLAALRIADSNFDAGIMADLGAFSRILQDAEAVYVSIDSSHRFSELLNFLGNVAEKGYDANTQMLSRPDAVTVSTVHKAKGLEFPCVFVVDAEDNRFPRTKKTRNYEGWLPEEVIETALSRGAYRSTREEEARLFYTALTRAERYLYVSGAIWMPEGKQKKKQSTFSGRLTNPAIRRDLLDASAPPAVTPAEILPRRRGGESILPTTFSQIRYFLRCPKDYQLRNVYGFSPPIGEMFGFGQTVHAAVGKLHEKFENQRPTQEEAQTVADDIFHLKHVPPSSNPAERPGGYENAKSASRKIVSNYADEYGQDFEHKRQVERPFEVPVADAVVSGAIDLLLRVDDDGDIVGSSVIDFKTMEGGSDPLSKEEIPWEELTLQVQLYALGAEQVLGEHAKTGAIHLLKDGQRITVPVDEASVEAALKTIEWAVKRVMAGDFPMRPSPTKCESCDFRALCAQQLQDFQGGSKPPALHLPQDRETEIAAIADITDP